MLLSIVSLILNILYCVVLNLELYTDRAVMPTGEIREWHRSPITRLQISDKTLFLYLQAAFVVVSILASVLILLGVRNSVVHTVCLVCTIASTVTFAVIMFMTGNAHVNYS